MQLSLQFIEGIYNGDIVTIQDSTAFCHASKKKEWVLGLSGIVVKVLSNIYFVKVKSYIRIDGIHKGELKKVPIETKIYTVKKVLK